MPRRPYAGKILVPNLVSYTIMAPLSRKSLSLRLQLHDAIHRLRFYSNSLIRVLSLSNSHNNVVSIQKNRGDKSHRVIVALEKLQFFNHKIGLSK